MIFMRFLKKTTSLEEAGGHLVTDSCDEAVLGDIPPHRGWWGTAWKGHQDIPRSSKIKKGHRKRNKTQLPKLQYDFVHFFYTVFWMFQVQVLYVFPFFRLSLKQQKMYPELTVLKPGHQRRSVAFRFLVSDECLVLSEDSEAASRIMFVFFPSVSVIPHHIPYIPFGYLT